MFIRMRNNSIIKVLAFADNIRKFSVYKKRKKIAVLAAKKERASITVIDSTYLPMPIYNQDLEAEQDMPEKVRAFIDLIIKAEVHSSNLGRWKQIIIQYCWSFYPSLALSQQLRSLLCACCDTTKDKQEFCPISDDYLFPDPLL